jgi:hypothetical protein
MELPRRIPAVLQAAAANVVRALRLLYSEVQKDGDPAPSAHAAASIASVISPPCRAMPGTCVCVTRFLEYVCRGKISYPIQPITLAIAL